MGESENGNWNWNSIYHSLAVMNIFAIISVLYLANKKYSILPIIIIISQNISCAPTFDEISKP